MKSSIPETEGARGPFFSPDGEWIGFWAKRELWKVFTVGGRPLRVCEWGSAPLGARWESDGTIVFGAPRRGVMRVAAEGGTPELMFEVREHQKTFYAPQLLPGGKAVLFSLGSNILAWSNAQMLLHNLETGERRVVMEGGRRAQYVPSGHLIYAVDDTLWASRLA